jgi:hypothetical protein
MIEESTNARKKNVQCGLFFASGLMCGHFLRLTAPTALAFAVQARATASAIENRAELILEGNLTIDSFESSYLSVCYLIMNRSIRKI